MFSFAQLIPTFRARPIVQEGTGYFFVYTCLSQIAWAIFFSFRMFLVSFVCICVTFGSLIFLRLSQNLCCRNSMIQNRKEYWLFQFPFELHLGWTMVVLAVNLSLFSTQAGGKNSLELPLAIILMSIMLLMAFFFAGIVSNPDFVIPFVMIWAFLGLGFQLRHPNQELFERYSEEDISCLSTTSFAFAIIIASFSGPRFLYRIWRERFTIQVLQLE